MDIVTLLHALRRRGLENLTWERQQTAKPQSNEPHGPSCPVHADWVSSAEDQAIARMLFELESAQALASASDKQHASDKPQRVYLRVYLRNAPDTDKNAHRPPATQPVRMHQARAAGSAPEATQSASPAASGPSYQLQVKHAAIVRAKTADA